MFPVSLTSSQSVPTLVPSCIPLKPNDVPSVLSLFTRARNVLERAEPFLKVFLPTGNSGNTGNKHSGSITYSVPSLDRLLRTLGTALRGEMREGRGEQCQPTFLTSLDFEMPNSSF